MRLRVNVPHLHPDDLECTDGRKKDSGGKKRRRRIVEKNGMNEGGRRKVREKVEQEIKGTRLNLSICPVCRNGKGRKREE